MPSVPWFDFSIVLLAAIDGLCKLAVAYLAWHAAAAIRSGSSRTRPTSSPSTEERGVAGEPAD